MSFESEPSSSPSSNPVNSSDFSTDSNSTLSSNQLYKAKSPYLLQHQDNPVHWMEWGDAAFELAQTRDVPIFLSIGYSTCHWCHVMAHDSFEDTDVAALLNQHFVCIKVDREERPDIDHLYMSVCQVYTGTGGWPLTIVMTPQKQPFFAGTYFPKKSLPNRIGMMDLLPKINTLWTTKRSELEHDASQIITGLIQASFRVGTTAMDESTTEKALNLLTAHYDAEYGGFSDAPKFPSPHVLLFLMNSSLKKAGTLTNLAFLSVSSQSTSQDKSSEKTATPSVMDMVHRTLVAMRFGGVYDHIGGGIHRYSTDREWIVPHFEKMLYDQAMCLAAYSMAYSLTKTPFFLEVGQEILQYLTREMKSESGLFYSAQDADTNGEEGVFYQWDYRDLQRLLTPEELSACEQFWDIKPDGNFLDESTQIPSPHNLLYRTLPTDITDIRHVLDGFYKTESEDSPVRYDDIRSTLLAERVTRVHPQIDTKCLADWNGLLLWGMAWMALVDSSITPQVEALADALLATVVMDSGRLWHAVKDGEGYIPGGLSDYAALAIGTYYAFILTSRPRYLVASIQCITIANDLFWDHARGGYFMSSIDTTDTLIRQKETYDGAVPSSNALMLYAMTCLAPFVSNALWTERSAMMLTVFSELISQYPAAYCFWMMGIQGFYSEKRLILVAGQSVSDVLSAIQILRNTVSLTQPVIGVHSDNITDLTKVMPWLSGIKLTDTIYYYSCNGTSCSAPVEQAQDLTRDPVE